MTTSASLVLFHNNPSHYTKAINSFLDGSDGIIHVIDNSNPKIVDKLFDHPRVRYTHTYRNLGFGRAHNIAFSFVFGKSEFHLILNPDVSFDASALETMSSFIRNNPKVGALMPRINYPDNSLQRLCKLLPTPIDLFLRRFGISEALKANINRNYELHSLPQDRPSIVPSLSGCCLLVRTALLREIGGFDPRFFMYMEDVDLVRRIGDHAETIYFPSAQATHDYARGSYRSTKLLFYHLHSALLYFNKWGWFFDKVRYERNREFRRGSRVIELIHKLLLGRS